MVYWWQCEKTPPAIYLYSTFSLHKPATQHGLNLPISQLCVSRLDFSLHCVLQQQTSQTPIEELTGCLPFKYIL